MAKSLVAKKEQEKAAKEKRETDKESTGSSKGSQKDEYELAQEAFKAAQKKREDDMKAARVAAEEAQRKHESDQSKRYEEDLAAEKAYRERIVKKDQDDEMARLYEKERKMKDLEKEQLALAAKFDAEEAAKKKKALADKAQRLRKEWNYPEDRPEDKVPKSYAGRSYHDFQLGWKRRNGLPKAPVERFTEHGSYEKRYMKQEHGGNVKKVQVATEGDGQEERLVCVLRSGKDKKKWEKLKAPKSTKTTTENRSAYSAQRRPQSAHDAGKAKQLVAYSPNARRNEMPRNFVKVRSKPIQIGVVDEAWEQHKRACHRQFLRSEKHPNVVKEPLGVAPKSPQAKVKSGPPPRHTTAQNKPPRQRPGSAPTAAGRSRGGVRSTVAKTRPTRPYPGVPTT